MSDLPNVTGRISHLRDRKTRSPILGGEGPENPTPGPKKQKKPGRRFATDSFSIFVYALLAVAIVTQLILIVWLDLI